MPRHRGARRRRLLSVVVAGAGALQPQSLPRRRTARFSDAAPAEVEAEADALNASPEIDVLETDATPVEAVVVSEAVETAKEREARDDEGPLKEFDWDAHLKRIEEEEDALRDEANEEERVALAGGDEWTGDAEALRPVAVVDDEPAFLKPSWDEVDPQEVDFRNPPPSRGATWSRIHTKAAWHQFEAKEGAFGDVRLKTEEGWERFDQRGYTVSENLFEPSLEFTFGKLDLDVVERIQPAMGALGSICTLLEAADGIIRIKYAGPARNRVGIEAYATGLVGDLYPDMTDLSFEARFVSDYLDGSSAHAADGWRQ